MVHFGQIHRILAPVPNVMVALHARERERRQYHLFQFPAINHEALPERGKSGRGRAGVAWRSVAWRTTRHGSKQEEASEDGSIALIFHDLSHSPLAFRGRPTYEGRGEGEEARPPPLAKQERKQAPHKA